MVQSVNLPPLSEELKQQALDAYAQANGCKAEAARLLNIPVSTFKKRYQIATGHIPISHPIKDIFNSGKPRDHLILPDRQARPGCDNAIDHAVGNYIARHQPEVIIDIGDHADMPSLSEYDIGKRSFEGRRYNEDIEASIHANEIQWNIVAQKAPRYKPLKVLTLGNHENRVNRATENDPKLYGLISTDDFQYSRFFDRVAPFLDAVSIDGVCYVHYAYKKMPQQPIGGKHQARSILDHQMMSTTVGHTPEFDYAEAYRGDDRRIQCIVAGARFDHHEEYAGPRNRRYWRGVVHKKSVKDGNYDFETVSLERLLREYL
jgi:hypothetical protein